jgi:CheY-like chemotaxis protein
MISVLYVDDESALLEIGRMYLERTGQYMVDTAESATSALEKRKSIP